MVSLPLSSSKISFSPLSFHAQEVSGRYTYPIHTGTDDIHTVQEVAPRHTVAYVAALTREWPLASRFYRAMHFSAKRGIAIACRLYVCLSVTLVNCDHIG